MTDETHNGFMGHTQYATEAALRFPEGLADLKDKIFLLTEQFNKEYFAVPTSGCKATVRQVISEYVDDLYAENIGTYKIISDLYEGE